MKQYPSIEYWNKGIFGSNVWAFDKLDGSNIRFEWSRKRGWYKFGTRKTMIDEKNEQFGQSITMFLEKYSDMDKVFYQKEYRNSQNFVAFCEWYGQNSFAGRHEPDDKMDIVLFDVCEYKKGFIHPQQFIDHFGHLGIPKVVYEGVYDEEFINSVKMGKYPLSEGVIAKGVRKTKGNELTWMVKIKTNEWLNKLKNNFGEEQLLNELNRDKSLL
jgi:hypothetical protein